MPRILVTLHPPHHSLYTTLPSIREYHLSLQLPINMTRASSSAAAASSSAQPPPQPDNIAETITPAELVALIKDEGKVAGKDYLIVDVRRTEFDVSTERLQYGLPRSFDIHFRYGELLARG